MTPLEMARQLETAAQRLPEALRRAEEASTLQAYHTFRIYSHGPYSSAQLAAMGHPYRHGGKPPMHPAFINYQTGRFEKSFLVALPMVGTDGIRSLVWNSVFYGRFLASGTVKMIMRSLPERVERDITPERLMRIDAAISITIAGG